jgi:hypothetical protein
MSASSKGAQYEREAMAVLESQGWTVYRAGKVLMRIPARDGKPAFSRSSQHDILGAFDLMAIKPGEPVRFVQVSTKTQGWDKRKQVASVLPVLPLEHCDAEIWLFVGGRRESGGQVFRVTRWNGFDWYRCDDQRCIPAEKKAKAATPRSSARIAQTPTPEPAATQP